MSDCSRDLASVRTKLRPPIVVVLGSPAETAQLVSNLPPGEVVCYQMDLYQAERLEEELSQRDLAARIVTSADLWDLQESFQTVLYAAAKGGERSLKLDMIEQAFHIFLPRGILIVLSPYEKEQLFPGALKKVFGRVHSPATEGSQVFWCQRDRTKPRRRHEVVFQVHQEDGPSLRFLSRPGVSSYGRFDNGARALVETMIIEPGDRIVDIGCGCGTNAIVAARRSGAQGSVAMIDSNLRALALAEHNARINGVAHFQTIASSTVAGVPLATFDVALANPPYYAQASIAQLFIKGARVLLCPGGRFYLVTKQPDQVGPMVAEEFGRTEVHERRGYIILSARAPESGPA